MKTIILIILILLLIPISLPFWLIGVISRTMFGGFLGGYRAADSFYKKTAMWAYKNEL